MQGFLFYFNQDPSKSDVDIYETTDIGLRILSKKMDKNLDEMS